MNEARNDPLSRVTGAAKFKLDLQYNIYLQVVTLDMEHKGKIDPNFQRTASP